MFRYDRMNALFAETGVKKAHVIRLMGKSSYYLRDAEKLKMDMHPKYVQIIADALGTTPEYLTGESDEKKPAISDGLNKTQEELLRLISLLTDQECELLLKQVQGIIAAR